MRLHKEQQTGKERKKKEERTRLHKVRYVQ